MNQKTTTNPGPKRPTAALTAMLALALGSMASCGSQSGDDPAISEGSSTGQDTTIGDVSSAADVAAVSDGASKGDGGPVAGVDVQIADAEGPGTPAANGVVFDVGASVFISEFMISNGGALLDGDDRTSDWVELHNPTAAAVNLAGWGLSDDRKKLLRWTFPAVSIPSKGYLVVFASGQGTNTYKDAAGNLHTNFKLGSGNDWLSLAKPDGTLVFAYDSRLPSTRPDASYGMGFARTTFTSQTDALKYRVPTAGSVGTAWTKPGFDDATWAQLPAGDSLAWRVVKGPVSDSFGRETACGQFTASYPGWVDHAPAGGASHVRDGQLRLSWGGSGWKIMRTVRSGPVPSGPLTVRALVGGTPGSEGDYAAGLVVGKVFVFLHPGYKQGNLHLETNSIGSISPVRSLGFTPAVNVLHPMEVVVTPKSGGYEFKVKVTDGQKASNVYETVEFVTTAQMGGVIDEVGVVRSGIPGGDALFDDFYVPWVAETLPGAAIAKAMHGVQTSVYVRKPFSVAALPVLDRLYLVVNYTGGFVAYLNGTEIAARNAPAKPAWNAAATASEPDAPRQVAIDVTAAAGLLGVGANVLALHGLSQKATDPAFHLTAELVALNTSKGELSFFATSTPKAFNGPLGQAIIGDEVNFSHPSGTFTEPLSLKLSTVRSGLKIVYTTDGTEPDAASSVYTGAISLTKTAKIRAMALASAGQFGPTRTGVFLHLENDARDFTSPLPIVLVHNFGCGSVPYKGWSLDGSGVTQVPRQPVAFAVFDKVGDRSSMKSAPHITTRAGLRRRGGFSSTFPRPPYTVEMWDRSDQDKDVKVLGMPAESDWILYAPNKDWDRSLMHNTFMFEVSDQIGRYAVRRRYVEVFLNTAGTSTAMAHYKGMHVLHETVKRGPDRYNFEKLSPDGTKGGWMLGIHKMDPKEPGSSLEPQNFHTAGPNRVLETPPNKPGQGDDLPDHKNSFLNFDSPKGYDIVSAQRSAITNWFKTFEDALYAANFSNPTLGYRKYLDVDDFIDFYIMHNLAMNRDNGIAVSAWVWKASPAEKLRMGPVWDYDLAFYNNKVPPSTLPRVDTNRIWYKRMFEDPTFEARYKERWKELRKTALSNASLMATIDKEVAKITAEVALRHGISDWPTRVQAFKDWIKVRLATIDADVK